MAVLMPTTVFGYIGGAFDTLEKREEIYAEYGNPWDERFLPPEEAFTEIKTKLHSLEERDYPWMPLNCLGSIWEYIFEGLGPRQIADLSRKNPSALHQILEENMKSLYYCNERLLEEGGNGDWGFR